MTPRPHHIKDTAVRSLFTVGCRGKRKTHLNAEALKLLTALTNLLVQETLQRAAESAVSEKRKTVSDEDLQRVLASISLDFSA